MIHNMDFQEQADFFQILVNIVNIYIKKNGMNIDKYQYLNGCIQSYNNCANNDKNVLYTPNTIDSDDVLYLLYVNDKHLYTSIQILPLFYYLAKNNTQNWDILEC